MRYLSKKRQYHRLKMPHIMNMLRNRLLTAFPEAHFTYGYITTVQRKKLGLAKAHYRDAVAISGIQQIIEEPNSVVMFDQFRTKKRSLHEATARRGRKQKNATQKRVKKNTKPGLFIEFQKSSAIPRFTRDSAALVFHPLGAPIC
ncbi:hypothetical protein LM010_04360 [Lacticaseibacillus manihotivorans]|uniref:Uncharacterized protein n=1 Tax=Lacticaseibacillus manihotivorans TaxID=88233 RepID=A0A5P8JNA1_9LACO|nr:hypothetical protein [Lacticaseibacillus manihotivorans]QFQ90705.1 hypothetical protein LM010_04360 [Lacticaseibacillus manihotivorans]